MPDWKKADGRAQRFDVLLFEQFSNHCLANTIEPLRAANTFLGRPAYAWRILTLDGRPATSSSGFPVVPERPFSSEARGDALILSPSYGYQRFATPALARTLRAAAARYRALIGLDGGAWLLAAAGLLTGRAATIHFDEFDAFAERFPEVDARRERYVVDGDRITAGGASTSFELMLSLIEQDHGAALTLEILGLFMAREDGLGSGPSAASRDRRVRRALEAMKANLETPLSIAAVSRSAGCAQRDLETRFRQAFGAAPRTVYQRLRLTHARRLLEAGDMAVAEAALRSGYRDPSAFARAFRREFGASPRSVRQGS